MNFFITYGLSGYSSILPTAYLTTTNYQTGKVETKNFKTRSKNILGSETSIGLQIYFNDKFDIITKLNWYSVDVGYSINGFNFNGDWPTINVRSSIISFSAGVAFPLSAKK